MRSVRLTGVDLLVLCECNETESSGPKLSKKCEASGKQTNKQNAAQLLIFGLFINQVTINQISKYFAYYANCKTKESEIDWTIEFLLSWQIVLDV